MSQKIIRDYLILETLGSGAYGIVYKVRKKTEEIFYVIKQIPLFSLNNDQINDVKQEAKILSTINSKYLVKYFDSFEENNNLYIVMEYCDNGDLSHFLENHQKTNLILKEEIIWKIFIKITIGLSAIHKLKILHRDLKSLNIFLMKNLDVKIGDLGVAKMLIQTNYAKTFIGTPYYLSPEICNDKPYNDKSDVWALGCILYELCTYSKPFQAKSQGAIILKILTKTPEKISNYYSNELQELINIILNKNEKQRPSCYDLLKRKEVIEKAKKYGLFNDVINVFPDIENLFNNKNCYENNKSYISKKFCKRNIIKKYTVDVPTINVDISDQISKKSTVDNSRIYLWKRKNSKSNINKNNLSNDNEYKQFSEISKNNYNNKEDSNNEMIYKNYSNVSFYCSNNKNSLMYFCPPSPSKENNNNYPLKSSRFISPTKESNYQFLSNRINYIKNKKTTNDFSKSKENINNSNNNGIKFIPINNNSRYFRRNDSSGGLCNNKKCTIDDTKKKNWNNTKITFIDYSKNKNNKSNYNIKSTEVKNLENVEFNNKKAIKPISKIIFNNKEEIDQKMKNFDNIDKKEKNKKILLNSKSIIEIHDSFHARNIYEINNYKKKHISPSPKMHVCDYPKDSERKKRTQKNEELFKIITNINVENNKNELEDFTSYNDTNNKKNKKLLKNKDNNTDEVENKLDNKLELSSDEEENETVKEIKETKEIKEKDNKDIKEKLINEKRILRDKIDSIKKDMMKLVGKNDYKVIMDLYAKIENFGNNVDEVYEKIEDFVGKKLKNEKRDSFNGLYYSLITADCQLTQRNQQIRK